MPRFVTLTPKLHSSSFFPPICPQCLGVVKHPPIHQMYCQRSSKLRSRPEDNSAVMNDALKMGMKKDFKTFRLGMIVAKFEVQKFDKKQFKMLARNLYNIEEKGKKLNIRFRNPKSFATIFFGGAVIIHGSETIYSVEVIDRRLRKLISTILKEYEIIFSQLRYNFINCEAMLKFKLPIEHVDLLYDAENRPGYVMGNMVVFNRKYFVTLYHTGRIRFSMSHSDNSTLNFEICGYDFAALYQQLFQNARKNGYVNDERP